MMSSQTVPPAHSHSPRQRRFSLIAASFAAALIGTVSAASGDGVNDGPYAGGVFARRPVVATSTPVPAPMPTNKAWLLPPERDTQGRTNQIVVRINSRSTGLATELSRNAPAPELDTRPAFERNFVANVDAQRDPTLLQALGGAVAARPVIGHARMSDEARLAADDNDPAEHLQQFIVDSIWQRR